MKRKLVAEVDYLEQIVANRAAWLAIGEMPFDLQLLAQLERAVDVIRNQFLTLLAIHDSTRSLYCLLRSWRNLIRALCSCDFEVPTLTCRISEISSCS